MHRPVRLLLALAVGIVIVTPASALADPPFQERISDPVGVVLPGTDFCGFDVQAEIEQKFKVIIFSGDRGTLWTGMTVGKIKAVLTDAETGETISLSIPGPGFLDASGTPIVGTGPWVVFVPGQPDDRPLRGARLRDGEGPRA